MLPIAARCGRRPPIGKSRSHRPSAMRGWKRVTNATKATKAPTRPARFAIPSLPGADHESLERTVVAFSRREMVGARSVCGRARHRIQSYPRWRPALRARGDIGGIRLARSVLLPSRRRLLVRISAHRGCQAPLRTSTRRLTARPAVLLFPLCLSHAPVFVETPIHATARLPFV